MKTKKSQKESGSLENVQGTYATQEGQSSSHLERWDAMVLLQPITDGGIESDCSRDVIAPFELLKVVIKRESTTTNGLDSINIGSESEQPSTSQSQSAQLPTNDSLSTPSSDKKTKSEKPPMVGVFEVFRYSDFMDKVLIVVGLGASIGQGIALPFMIVLFGSITDFYVGDGQYRDWLKYPENWANVSYCFDVSQMDILMDKNLFQTELVACNRSDIANMFPPTSVYSEMSRIAGQMCIIALTVIVSGYLMTMCLNTAALRQSFRIRTGLFRAIMRQDIGWFDTHNSGELNTRLADDIDKIEQGIGDKLATFFQFMTTFIGGFILSFFHSWHLTLVLIAVCPLLAICGVIMGKLGAVLTARELKAYAMAGSVAEEVIGNIRTVVAFGGQEKEVKRYEKDLDKAKSIGIKKGMVNSGGMGLLYTVMFSAYALAFWYGSVLFEKKIDSAGDILVVFFGIMIGAFSLGNAAPQIEAFSVARGGAYAAFRIIDRVPPIDNSSEEGQTPQDLKGNIQFKDVHFNYPSRPDVPILKGLDLDVNVGQTVALVGASGCGKSTTIQLLQRFYDPAIGQVMVDNIDIKDYNLKWLRRHIGVVSQEPVLFDTTIDENIRYGREDVTQEEIVHATQMANAYDFIQKLPEKFSTLVGERGAQLSGGQKQRIAIARALVRDPKILLLDEATSALDTQSEAIVQSALDKARQGRTTIIIAHRLSTVRNADVIAGFRDGHIVEKGTHEQLMKEGGIYYTLATNQQSQVLEDHSKATEMDAAEHNPDLSCSGSIRSDKSRKSIASKISSEAEEILPEVSMLRLLKLNSPELPFIVIGCFGALISGGIQPAFAVIFAQMLGVFGITDPHRYRSQADLYSLMFLVIAAGSGIALLCQSFFFAKSGEELTKRIRRMTFKALLRQDISFFDDHNNSTGALCARLATDASAVQGATGARLGMVVQSICGLCCGLTIGFVYNWKIALLMCGFIPFLVGAGIIRAKLFSGKGKGFERKKQEDAGRIAIQSIENIRTVATLTKEQHFYNEYYGYLERPNKLSIKKTHIEGLAYGFGQSIMFFTNAACFTLGGYLIDNEGAAYQDVFKVFMAVAFSAIGIGQASSLAPDYAKAKTSAAKIFHLLDNVPLIDSYSDAGKKLDEVQGEITFEDIHFKYPTRPTIPVLQGINLHVPLGQTVALVGSSGCGKSTIVQLVERFYEPLSGIVRLDGVNFEELNLPWLRQNIGIVSQEPALFDCSISNNIAYGDNSREVPMDEIIEAAKKANIHNFVVSLPNGYDTNVGGRGTQLSGGQKQRIAIARALLRNPKVLLLDEATSALDTESEKIVQEALDKAQEGRTCIVIAHRLSTIKNANVIVVIDKGQIVESGTHSSLLEQKGFYYRLKTAQKSKQ